MCVVDNLTSAREVVSEEFNESTPTRQKRLVALQIQVQQEELQQRPNITSLTNTIDRLEQELETRESRHQMELEAALEQTAQAIRD